MCLTTIETAINQYFPLIFCGVGQRKANWEAKRNTIVYNETHPINLQPRRWQLQLPVTAMWMSWKPRRHRS